MNTPMDHEISELFNKLENHPDHKLCPTKGKASVEYMTILYKLQNLTRERNRIFVYTK